MKSMYGHFFDVSNDQTLNGKLLFRGCDSGGMFRMGLTCSLPAERINGAVYS